MLLLFSKTSCETCSSVSFTVDFPPNKFNIKDTISILTFYQIFKIPGLNFLWKFSGNSPTLCNPVFHCCDEFGHQVKTWSETSQQIAAEEDWSTNSCSWITFMSCSRSKSLIWWNYTVTFMQLFMESLAVICTDTKHRCGSVMLIVPSGFLHILVPTL